MQYLEVNLFILLSELQENDKLKSYIDTILEVVKEFFRKLVMSLQKKPIQLK